MHAAGGRAVARGVAHPSRSHRGAPASEDLVQDLGHEAEPAGQPDIGVDGRPESAARSGLPRLISAGLGAATTTGCGHSVITRVPIRALVWLTVRAPSRRGAARE